MGPLLQCAQRFSQFCCDLDEENRDDLSPWNPHPNHNRIERTFELIAEEDNDTSHDEEDTYLEHVYEIERWNPIFCTGKRNMTVEPILREESDASNNNNRHENDKNKMQWIIKDKHYKATSPVKECTSLSEYRTTNYSQDSHQPGMPAKDDIHSNFSLSENEKSRRQEESRK